MRSMSRLSRYYGEAQLLCAGNSWSAALAQSPAFVRAQLRNCVFSRPTFRRHLGSPCRGVRLCVLRPPSLLSYDQ